jgi:hypothetical protein
MAWSANVAGWKNNTLPDFVQIQVIVSGVKGVLEPTIE